MIIGQIFGPLLPRPNGKSGSNSIVSHNLIFCGLGTKVKLEVNELIIVWNSLFIHPLTHIHTLADTHWHIHKIGRYTNSYTHYTKRKARNSKHDH